MSNDDLIQTSRFKATQIFYTFQTFPPDSEITAHADTLTMYFGELVDNTIYGYCVSSLLNPDPPFLFLLGEHTSIGLN